MEFISHHQHYIIQDSFYSRRGRWELIWFIVMRICIMKYECISFLASCDFALIFVRVNWCTKFCLENPLTNCSKSARLSLIHPWTIRTSSFAPNHHTSSTVPCVFFESALRFTIFSHWLVFDDTVDYSREK